jgi:carboxyl-terminal processing protease
VERAKITAVESGRRISEADLKGHLENVQASQGDDLESSDNFDPEISLKLLEDDNQLFEAFTLLRGLSILEQRKQLVKPAEQTTPSSPDVTLND